MGENETYVDAAALLDVARRCDAVADLVDGLVRDHLDRLTFDGSAAGEGYTARGNALRHAIDDVVDQVLAWATAMRDIASALVVSGRRFAEADTGNAVRLG